MNERCCWFVAIVAIAVTFCLGCFVLRYCVTPQMSAEDSWKYTYNGPPLVADYEPTALGLALAGVTFEPAQEYQAHFKELHVPVNQGVDCITCHRPYHGCVEETRCCHCHDFESMSWSIEGGTVNQACASCHYR